MPLAALSRLFPLCGKSLFFHRTVQRAHLLLISCTSPDRSTATRSRTPRLSKLQLLHTERLSYSSRGGLVCAPWAHCHWQSSSWAKLWPRLPETHKTPQQPACFSLSAPRTTNPMNCGGILMSAASLMRRMWGRWDNVCLSGLLAKYLTN